jgi:hypothetical protein
MDAYFHQYLQDVQEMSPQLFDPITDIEWVFSVKRSLRRGSTMHARNQDFLQDVIKSNNQWRKQERAKLKKPSLSMIDTYLDVIAGLDFGLKYSLAH